MRRSGQSAGKSVNNRTRQESQQAAHGARPRPWAKGWGIALGGLFVALTVLLLRPVEDFDVWFARLAGRYVMEFHAIPRHEFYLYPVLGEPSQFSAWGFGLMLEAVSKVWGETGVAVVNAALGAGTLTLLLMASRARIKAAPWLALLALAVPFVCLDLRLNYRPETTLCLALGGSLLLLEKFLATNRVALLLPLPLIAWLLAQFHTTSIFIAIVYSVYLAEWWLGARPQPAKVRLKLVAIGLATLLVPALNPYGFQRLLVLIPSFHAAGGAVSPLVEYIPMWQTEFKAYFLALAVLALLCLLQGPRRLADLLMLGGFGFLAYSHARNIGLFGLALYLPLVRTMASLPLRLSPTLVGGAAGTIWAGAVMLIMSVHSWGVGLARDAFPEKAAARIPTIVGSGPVLNFFHLGSYLAWKLGSRYGMLIDGHLLHASQADHLHDALFRADRGWQRRLEEDGVNIIVTPATLQYSGAMIPLVQELATDPDWVLTEAEPAALLFVRRSISAGRPDIPVLPARLIWSQVIEETDKVVRDYPDHAEAYAARAIAYAALGDAARAAEADALARSHGRKS